MQLADNSYDDILNRLSKLNKRAQIVESEYDKYVLQNKIKEYEQQIVDFFPRINKLLDIGIFVYNHKEDIFKKYIYDGTISIKNKKDREKIRIGGPENRLFFQCMGDSMDTFSLRFQDTENVNNNIYMEFNRFDVFTGEMLDEPQIQYYSGAYPGTRNEMRYQSLRELLTGFDNMERSFYISMNDIMNDMEHNLNKKENAAAYHKMKEIQNDIKEEMDRTDY